MKKNFYQIYRKAFTLVEMLIVVIIIGILAAALLPKLKGAQERARDTARKANLSQVGAALEMYFNDQGSYPTGPCLTSIERILVPTYIGNLPSDPQKGRITYSTKVGGCGDGKGVYAYQNLKRNNSRAAGAVTIANIEAQGSVGNYIIPDANLANYVIFSGTKGTNKIAAKTLTSDEDFQDAAIKNGFVWAVVTDANGFNEAKFAEKITCGQTTLSGSVHVCNAPGGSNMGRTTENNAMVYAQFN